MSTEQTDQTEQSEQSEQTGTRRPRRRAVVAGAGLVVLAAAAVAVVVARGGKELEPPYADARSAGLITLCSAAGERVTGGDLDDRPFADIALGRTGVPDELDPTGAVATLFAYQPRAGIGTEEFSGQAITAASTLARADRPAVAITADGWSLGDFVTAFPARLDGYVQLRLYLGTAAAGTLGDRPYDTADLRVDGDRWELVRGGHASCSDAGTALVR